MFFRKNLKNLLCLTFTCFIAKEKGNVLKHSPRCAEKRYSAGKLAPNSYFSATLFL